MAGVKKSPTKKSFYEAVFKHSLEAIAILDRRGRIVAVNSAACKLLGATRKKLINKSIADFLQSSLDWKHVRERAEM